MVMGNLAATSHGACMVIPAPSFEPAATLAAVQDERCTSLYGVPTMFIAELGLPDFADYDLSTLRTGIMAGSPCPVEVMKRVVDEMHMGEVAICYGMTETSPVSTMTRVDDDLARRTETVGRTMPHLESKVVDPVTGLTLPRGEAGELCTRGHTVMLGYWNNPEATAAALNDGWLRTGDVGRLDADGFLTLSDRSKDVIISGGTNIYPREVEEALLTHADVREVSAIGLPDPEWGEIVVACMVLAPNAAPDDRKFDAHCLASIARFKRPKRYVYLDALPKNNYGKVLKTALRERLGGKN